MHEYILASFFNHLFIKTQELGSSPLSVHTFIRGWTPVKSLHFSTFSGNDDNTSNPKFLIKKRKIKKQKKNLLFCALWIRSLGANSSPAEGWGSHVFDVFGGGGASQFYMPPTFGWGPPPRPVCLWAACRWVGVFFLNFPACFSLPVFPCSCLLLKSL